MIEYEGREKCKCSGEVTSTMIMGVTLLFC